MRNNSSRSMSDSGHFKESIPKMFEITSFTMKRQKSTNPSSQKLPEKNPHEKKFLPSEPLPAEHLNPSQASGHSSPKANKILLKTTSWIFGTKTPEISKMSHGYSTFPKNPHHIPSKHGYTSHRDTNFVSSMSSSRIFIFPVLRFSY